MSNTHKNSFSKYIRDLLNSSYKNIEQNKNSEEKEKLKKTQFNILITGATGSGKSSTINALFNENIAKVGVGASPETMKVKKYKLNKFTFWDTPGLGDSKENDKLNAKRIKNLLINKDKNGLLLIDFVLVIIDGNGRDLGTTYHLINNIIIPKLGENAGKKILIAINQADMAMKGRNWNYNKNEPEPKLIEFLEEKTKSVKERIKKETNINIETIYYSAGYKNGNEEQKPWNLDKLLSFKQKIDS